jgi:predicted Fe-Mo cluster-binding NifX family protein
MKIAIASDDQQTIASHFGRTRGFLIYNIDQNKVINREYRINDFTGHARGMEGADHSMDRHSPILAALHGCQAVIARGMGRRIYDDLQSAGIEAFIVNEENADQALQLYLQNVLQDNPDKGCEH